MGFKNNKKGVSFSWGVLLGAVVFGLMILFYWGFIQGNLYPLLDTTLQDMREILRGRDYDGDGRHDFWDDCPCSGEFSNIRPNIRGITYCSAHPDYCEEGLEGFRMVTGAAGQEYCVYRKDDCLRYLYDVYTGKRLGVGVADILGGNNE